MKEIVMLMFFALGLFLLYLGARSCAGKINKRVILCPVFGWGILWTIYYTAVYYTVVKPSFIIWGGIVLLGVTAVYAGFYHNNKILRRKWDEK